MKESFLGNVILWKGCLFIVEFYEWAAKWPQILSGSIPGTSHIYFKFEQFATNDDKNIITTKWFNGLTPVTENPEIVKFESDLL